SPPSCSGSDHFLVLKTKVGGLPLPEWYVLLCHWLSLFWRHFQAGSGAILRRLSGPLRRFRRSAGKPGNAFQMTLSASRDLSPPISGISIPRPAHRNSYWRSTTTSMHGKRV